VAPHGIRNISALESALARPFQTFDNKELYPTVIEKASALVESILNNHPFIDGNKRTGYVMMRLFLMDHSVDIDATQEEKYNLIIDIASGVKRFEQIVEWLEKHTK
jgi:death-on-curing protein